MGLRGPSTLNCPRIPASPVHRKVSGWSFCLGHRGILGTLTVPGLFSHFRVAPNVPPIGSAPIALSEARRTSSRIWSLHDTSCANSLCLSRYQVSEECASMSKALGCKQRVAAARKKLRHFLILSVPSGHRHSFVFSSASCSTFRQPGTRVRAHFKALGEDLAISQAAMQARPKPVESCISSEKARGMSACHISCGCFIVVQLCTGRHQLTAGN